MTINTNARAASSMQMPYADDQFGSVWVVMGADLIKVWWSLRSSNYGLLFRPG